MMKFVLISSQTTRKHAHQSNKMRLQFFDNLQQQCGILYDQILVLLNDNQFLFTKIMKEDEQYYEGIINCFPSGSSDSYCILKTTELTISSIILILSLLEIYRQITTYGFSFRWKIISLLLMVSSLAVNIAFCVWNTTYQLYSIESYLNNLYFLIIVGYVCRMYIVKNGYESIPWVHYGFITVLSVMGVFYTAILIDSLVHQNDPEMINNSCEEIWYLCVNVLCLILCLVALAVLYVNQKEEVLKIQAYSYSKDKVNNPLFSLWVWMGINTSAQIIDLVETGLLLNTTQDQYCMVIPDSNIWNNLLMFFFAIVTMLSGYIATLWYFQSNRRKIQQMHSIPSSSDNNKSSSQSNSEQIRYVIDLEMLDSFNDRFNVN